MESTHESLQSKVAELFGELKKLSSNYKLIKLNMDIVLHDTKNNKNFTFVIDEKLNFSVSSESLPEQEGGNLLLNDNTLSSGIFNTSINSEDTETQRIAITTSDMESTISEKKMNRANNKGLAGIFKGGFKNSMDNKRILSNDLKFSSTSDLLQTSELNTTVKNIFGKQKGGANVLSATSATSVTSENKVTGENYDFSATSLSATSDSKLNDVKSEFSATSMSATSDNKVGEMVSEFSATSMSATVDNKVGGMRHGFMSATLDNKVGGTKHGLSETSFLNSDNMLSNVSATSMSATLNNKVGGTRYGLSETSFLNSDNMLSNVSATSLTNYEPVTNSKGGFHKLEKNEPILSKMDLIRKKIKELDTISETDIFQKNKVTHSGGAHNKKMVQHKQIEGLNSSSTSSLCE